MIISEEELELRRASVLPAGEPWIVAVGESVAAELPSAAFSPGRWQMGARIEIPYTRAIISRWRRAAFADGRWHVTLDAIFQAGVFQFVWRTSDPEPPEFEVFLPLVVGGVGLGEGGSGLFPALGHGFPPVDRDAVTPVVDDVSRLERTRTSDGFGNEFETFTDETRPSATDVEEIIQHGVQIVLSTLPGRYPPEFWPATKRVITLYAAMTIEASFFKEQTVASAAGQLPWEAEYNSARELLSEQIAGAIHQNNLLGAMEPRTPWSGGVLT